MSFSEQFIDEIKSRNPIEEAVNRVVPLKRAGSNLVGVCPFHNEKTPSFTVFPATKSYYCFGCGAGGDVFSFVMQTEGLDYRGAVEALANRAGIPMEVDNTYGKPVKAEIGRQKIIDVTKAAGRFFYSCLYSDIGTSAREYLKKRKITSTTIKRFGIGYAPDSWDALTKHLKSKGFSDAEIKAAFLAGTSQKNGNTYDMFRNRIMFPIFDMNGDCVAFSGRRLNEADERKYINTSDTPAFKKSRVLFGLNIAKQQGDGTLILCEGAVDAIALQQAGFSNAIATLGTAITSEHARIIARFAKTVFIAYDVDSAGRTATDKAIKLLSEVGVSTKILELGEGAKDPDEYIKKFGVESFRQKLKGSAGQIDYTIDRIFSKYNTDNPDEKLRAASELYEYIATITNLTEREVYVSRVAQRLKIPSKVVSDEVGYRYRRNERSSASNRQKNDLRTVEGFGDKVNKDKIRFSATATLEEQLLGLFLNRPDIAKSVTPTVLPEYFATEFDRKVFELFKEEFLSGSEVTITKDGVLSAEEVSAVSRMIAKRSKLAGNTEEEAKGIVASLKKSLEKRTVDQKIAENPLDGLSDYVNTLRKNKSQTEG